MCIQQKSCFRSFDIRITHLNSTKKNGWTLWKEKTVAGLGLHHEISVFTLSKTECVATPTG